MNIRQTAKDYMKTMHISQTEVCKEMGVHFSTLNQYLRGKKRMSADNTQRLLDVLRLSAEGSMKSPEHQTMRDAARIECCHRRLTIAKVAQDLGISPSGISLYLSGKSLSTNRVELLLDYLGIRLVPESEISNRA